LVIPSMPGYGFSGKPATTGWGPIHIACAWVVLMKRLGYMKFVAQGGDRGAPIVDMMGVEAPPELLGIPSNMAGKVPADVATAPQFGDPPPSGLTAEEKGAWDQLDFCYKHGLAYARRWGTAHRRCKGLRIHPSA
jgi:hypothetical protein